MLQPPSDGNPEIRVGIMVDGSVLGARHNGLRRYLSSLLPQMIKRCPDARWHVCGRNKFDLLEYSAIGARPRPSERLSIVAHSRDGKQLVNGEVVDSVATRLCVHSDHLPAAAGRVLSLATSLPWWLRAHQPNLHWAPAHRLPIWVPAETARVVTIHDLCWALAPDTMQPETRWLDRLLMPRSLAMADRIIAVSESTRSELVERFPATAERIVVVHEAAETLPSASVSNAPPPLRITAPYVLFVGSHEPRKNLPRLMAAFAELPDYVRQSYLFVVAGARGWGDVNVVSTAATLGISEQVRVLGAVDDSSLATLYSHARCLAMPSLYEGFGLPVLEALSQGTPALIASGSSLPEVAGDAGLVVDPLSVDSIRAGLEAMLTDDLLHARLAAAAIPQASKFSWERAARETLAVFEEAIAVRKEKIRLGLV